MRLPEYIYRLKFQLITLCFATIAVYLNIFQNGFVIDDKVFILDWEAKNSVNIFHFFQGVVPPGHEGVYRPVRSILYAVYYQLAGINPLIYHLHSLVVHLGSTILVYFICREIYSGLKATSNKILHLFPFFAGLLFGLHPIHTETITYIASAMESIGLTMYLAAFYLYIRSSNSKKTALRYGSIFLGLLAFLTTEFSLTLPLILILYDLSFGYLNRRNFFRMIPVYMPYFIGVAFFLSIRFFLLNITTRGPYLADSVYLTMLTMTKVFVKYFLLVIFPINQANNHTIPNNIEAFVYRGYNPEPILQQHLADPLILGSIGIIAVLGFTAVKLYRKLPILSFGIGWFFITLLPVSEIIPQGSILNEKFLYLPSFGVILIFLTALLQIAGLDKKKLFLVNQSLLIPGVFLIVICFSMMTFIRNLDWRDELTLWTKDIKAYPQSNAYAYFQLGNAYLARGDFDTSIYNYEKAYQINPYFTVALASIGRVYEVAGEWERAAEHYEKVIAADPTFWEGYRNLANIYEQQGEFNNAREVLEKLKAIYPEFAQDALLSVPELMEATMGGELKKANLWFRYHLNAGWGLNLPSAWSLTETNSRTEITDETGSFSVTLSFDSIGEETNEEYVAGRDDSEYGEVVNQGLAKIPRIDWGYVKIFEKAGNRTMVFYLIDKNEVVKLVIFPIRENYAGVVDRMLGSIKKE